MEALDQYNNNYLAHYGVLGMKRGVRKNRGATINKAFAKLSKQRRIKNFIKGYRRVHRCNKKSLK